MLKYLVKRFLMLVPVFIVISIMIFGIVKAMPGDPVMIGINVTELDQMSPNEREDFLNRRREELGLNENVAVQYMKWMKRTLSGEYGYSNAYNKDVKNIIGPALKNSVKLNVFALIASLGVAIPLGIKSAVKKGKFFDKFWQVFSLIGISAPSFFIGLIFIFIFAINLGWFPLSGMNKLPDPYPNGFALFMDEIYHMILPVTIITFGSLASYIRYVRNAMLDVLKQDYIRTARSKGLSQKVVIYSHAFRNALIPIVTLIAFAIGGLFGGSIVIEQLFAWPGIGSELIKSITNLDYAILLTLLMFYAVISLLTNVIMDLGYALVDPRVKLN